MNNKPEISSPRSLIIKRASLNLKWAGTIGFWVQLVLGVISGVILLLAGSGAEERASQGTGLGLFSAACGLVALAIGIYFSFRYTIIAKLLQNPNPAEQPNKLDTLRIIRTGLIVNLVGMLLTIVGAQAIVGIVLAKSLARPQLAIGSDPKEFVNSLDLLLVQANTNTILAHFAGIVSSLLLLNRITK